MGSQITERSKIPWTTVDSKAGQGKYKVSLERLVKPKSKDRLRKQDRLVIGIQAKLTVLPMAKLIQKASKSWLVSMRLVLMNNISEK